MPQNPTLPPKSPRSGVTFHFTKKKRRILKAPPPNPRTYISKLPCYMLQDIHLILKTNKIKLMLFPNSHKITVPLLDLYH